jgi:hypothetical protein
MTHNTEDFASMTFDFGENFLDTIGSDTSERQKATAYATRSKRQNRRAKSEETLNEILPPVIKDGEAWHILSSGDIDSLSYLAHLLSSIPMDHVILSTWCMAMEDVNQLAAWLDEGRIGRLDAYVGEIFPSQYTDEHEQLVALLQQHGKGRVAVFRNHSKVYLCRSGDQAWVIESSANINTNPRTENTVITADIGLYLHHKAYFDGIKSFNRDFDQWTPA